MGALRSPNILNSGRSIANPASPLGITEMSAAGYESADDAMLQDVSFSEHPEQPDIQVIPPTASLMPSGSVWPSSPHIQATVPSPSSNPPMDAPPPTVYRDQPAPSNQLFRPPSTITSETQVYRTPPSAATHVPALPLRSHSSGNSSTSDDVHMDIVDQHAMNVDATDPRIQPDHNLELQHPVPSRPIPQFRDDPPSGSTRPSDERTRRLDVASRVTNRAISVASPRTSFLPAPQNLATETQSHFTNERHMNLRGPPAPAPFVSSHVAPRLTVQATTNGHTGGHGTEDHTSNTAPSKLSREHPDCWPGTALIYPQSE